MKQILLLLLISNIAFAQRETRTEICPVTGKELQRCVETNKDPWGGIKYSFDYCFETGVWLEYNSGYFVDGDFYNSIKDEFDSTLNVMVNILLEQYKLKYRQQREANIQQTARENLVAAKIKKLDAEIEVLRLEGKEVPDSLKAEMCNLFKAQKYSFHFDYCDYCECEKGSFFIDTTIIRGN